MRAAEQRAAELEAQLREVSGRAERLGAVEAELALARVGLTDPEAIGVARYYYDQLPKADRPALGDWIAKLRAEPTSIPRGLAPFLGAAGGGAAGGAGAAGAAFKGGNAGAAPVTPPKSGDKTASDLFRMTPAEYKAWKEGGGRLI